MIKYWIGCAGWGYTDWKNVFYSKNLPQNQWLTFYAKYFSFTEINTTFYQLPAPELVAKWRDAVPDSFRFSVKIWQDISHDLGSPELDHRVEQFFIHFSALKSKISAFLIQFPPRFGFSDKHQVQLTRLLKQIPKSYTYYLELRNDSWFEPSGNKNQISKIEMITLEYSHVKVATSYLEGFSAFYPEQQTDYYIRLLGDRKLEKFDRIQRNQDKILSEVENKLHDINTINRIDNCFLLFNNHFRGFAPQDAMEFAQRLGVPYKSLNSQKTLTDFLKPSEN